MIRAGIAVQRPLVIYIRNDFRFSKPLSSLRQILRSYTRIEEPSTFNWSETKYCNRDKNRFVCKYYKSMPPHFISSTASTLPRLSAQAFFAARISWEGMASVFKELEFLDWV